MRQFILILLLCASPVILSQEQKPDFSAEINEQVWAPFKSAYDAQDAEQFIGIHAKDVLRITQSGIREGEAFRENIRRNYNRKDRPRREIDFKFEHRIHSDTHAYEVGYYRVRIFQEEGNKDYFGRFSVLLKKINGTWKIAQDWDVDQINGVPVTAEDFEKL